MAGPLLGVPTLAITQQMTTAQRMANYESTVMAGFGLLSSTTINETVQGIVDLGLSVSGLAATTAAIRIIS